MAHILLIDDDPEIHEALRGPLQQIGHSVTFFDRAEDGLRLLKDESIDVVLLDNRMPRMTGLEFLEVLKQRGARVPVILMTSSLNDQTVIRATKMGALAYVVKPEIFGEILPELEPEIRRALDVGRRLREVPIPKADGTDDSLIVGRSKPMIEVFKQIALASEGDEPVLILGETGTGKDLVAQAIHTNSARKDNPFVVINCAGLTETLLNDELFGHERGAFSGADKLRKGHFEHANGGTLFLDEIGDMPLEMQAKLLRVLQNGEIMRIGSSEIIKINVRVLAATHRDLKTRASEGKFREDLYHRLEGETIHLPPLRERKGDVELLARRFLNRSPGESGTPPALHPDSLEVLRNHPWPGNIRQLQNVIRRASRKCRESRRAQIIPLDLIFSEMEVHAPADIGEPDEDGAQAGLRRAIAWAWNSGRPDLWPVLRDRLECELLRYAVAQPHVSQSQLAQRLGMAKNTLRARLKQYGIDWPADEE